MVPHQHIGMHKPASAAACLVECIEELFSTIITKEYITPIVATTHHMIHRSRVFNPYRPRHTQQSIRALLLRQSTIHGLADPPPDPPPDPLW